LVGLQADKAAMASLLARFKALDAEYHPPPNPNRLSAMYCAHVASTGGWVAPWYTQSEPEPEA